MGVTSRLIKPILVRVTHVVRSRWFGVRMAVLLENTTNYVWQAFAALQQDKSGFVHKSKLKVHQLSIITAFPVRRDAELTVFTRNRAEMQQVGRIFFRFPNIANASVVLCQG